MISIKKLILKDLVLQKQNEDHNLQQEDNSSAPEQVFSEEQIKKISYEQGYNEAKKHFETILEQQIENTEFDKTLKTKIENVSFEQNAANQLCELTTQILKHITEKLFIKLKPNFEEMMSTQLSKFIENNCSDGCLEITIHPTKEKICKKIINLDQWPKNLKNNIVITGNKKLDKNASIVKWKNSTIQYDPQLIAKKIDNLLSNLIATS